MFGLPTGYVGCWVRDRWNFAGDLRQPDQLSEYLSESEENVDERRIAEANGPVALQKDLLCLSDVENQSCWRGAGESPQAARGRRPRGRCGK
jgi:hypothetical protein